MKMHPKEKNDARVMPKSAQKENVCHTPLGLSGRRFSAGGSYFPCTRREESSDMSVNGDNGAVTSPWSDIEVPPSPALVADIMENMGVNGRDATILAKVLIGLGGFRVEHFNLMEDDVLRETIRDFTSASKHNVKAYVDYVDSSDYGDNSPGKETEHAVEENEDEAYVAPPSGGEIAYCFLVWYTPGILEKIPIAESEAVILARLLMNEGKCLVEDLVDIAEQVLQVAIKDFSAESKWHVRTYVAAFRGVKKARP